MIDFIQVTKRFGAQVVLSEVSFRIHPGEHVGVVGPNGAGKSTVFGLISGECAPDGGEVTRPKDTRLGHLRQQLHAYERDGSLLDHARDAIPELQTLSDEIHRIEHALPGLAADERKRMLTRLGELQHEFEHLGGYEMTTRAEAALSGLGFQPTDFREPFRTFSGGWQMRGELARTLISRPDILLLDEPSNYLDLPAVEWLKRYLKSFEGTLLLISHDRYLLETLTDRTLEISGGAAVKVSGGYGYYIRERAQRRERQEADYRRYSEEKARLEQFINRFRAQATKAAQVQSRIKMLEKLDAVAPPSAPPNFSKLRLPVPPASGARMLSLEHLGVSYDGQRWIFRDVNLEIEAGQKIALVGYNGMGKTTLLRVMAGVLAPTEGARRDGHNVVLGYQSQDFAETMPPDDTLLEIVRRANPTASEREARSLLGSFGFGGDAVGKTSRVLSGGEKIRLAFARIFIRPPNLLLLDEPTTNLDIHGREALEVAVREYKGTVCFVSHDVAFVRGAADRIISIGPAGLFSFGGRYDEYLEKLAQTESGSAASAQIPTADLRAPDAAPRGRDLRVARAREREARRVLQKMETRMEELHTEQRILHGRLSGGAAELDYAEVGRRLAEVTRELTEMENRWMEEADRLEAESSKA